MKASIYYLTLSILIFILIYNILIYNNKNYEKFTDSSDTSNTQDSQDIIDKFINKINKKKKIKNNMKNILPKCQSNNNLLKIVEYDDNDIIKLSINNKEFGNYTKQKYLQPHEALFKKEMCLDDYNSNNKSFIYKNNIYGTEDVYTNVCSSNTYHDYGRMISNEFESVSIKNIIENARVGAHNDCEVFYNNDVPDTLTINGDLYGNTKKYRVLSDSQFNLMGELNCDLKYDDIKDLSREATLTINDTIWKNTLDNIKISELSAADYKPCAINNEALIDKNIYTHNDTFIQKIQDEENWYQSDKCLDYLVDWKKVGNKVGEYSKEKINNTDCGFGENSHFQFTNDDINNSYNNNIDIDVEVIGEGGGSTTSNWKPILSDITNTNKKYVKTETCLKEDLKKKIYEENNQNSDQYIWGNTDYYSISNNNLWPDYLQPEIDNCLDCIEDICKYKNDDDAVEEWEIKKIITNTECAFPITDVLDNTILTKNGKNWYSDNNAYVFKKGDADDIIDETLKEEYNEGIKESLNNCSIKYSDIYNYTTLDPEAWSLEATLLSEIYNDLNNLGEQYAKNNCLLEYSNFFGFDDPIYYEYNYNSTQGDSDEIFYGKIASVAYDLIGTDELTYVKNEDLKDEIKSKVRNASDCIFYNNEFDDTKEVNTDPRSSDEWVKKNDINEITNKNGYQGKHYKIEDLKLQAITDVLHEINCDCPTGKTGDGCELCDEGYELDDTGANCTICPAGTYSTRSEATAGSQCISCVAGTYSTTPGATSVDYCLACPVNSTSPSGSTSNSACTCNLGYYLDTDTRECVECPAGTYSDTPGAIGASQCISCGADTYSTTLGANSVDDCLACPVNSTSPSGSTSNSACTCNLGYYLDTDTRECVECPAGTYSDTPGAIGASQCTKCLAGTYSTTPGATVASQCISCGADTYSTTLGANSVDDCLACPPNSTSQIGSDSSDDCQCNPGYYFDTSTGECVKCPVGTYRDTPGGEGIAACINCGEYTDMSGRKGFMSSQEGSTDASDCGFCQEGLYGHYKVGIYPNCGVCHNTRVAENGRLVTIAGDFNDNEGVINYNQDSGELLAWNSGVITENPLGLEYTLTWTNNSTDFYRIAEPYCFTCPEMKIMDWTNNCVCDKGYEPWLDDLAELDYDEVPGKAFARGNLHICKPCEDGYYKDIEGDYKCTQCPGSERGDDAWWGQGENAERILINGEVITSALPRDTQSTCNCPIGRRKAGWRGGDYYYCEKTPCETGQYRDVWCHDCPVGKSGNGSVCNYCEKNTYNNTAGAAECLQCGINKYTEEEGSIEIEKCLPVPSGHQINITDKNIELCPEGTYYIEGMPNPDDQAGCIYCESGFYADIKGSTSCKPHTDCASSNKVISTGGTNMADVTCGECTAGYIKSDFDENCIPNTSNPYENTMLIQSSKYRTDKVFQFCPPGWYKTDSVQVQGEDYVYPCLNYWQNEIEIEPQYWETEQDNVPNEEIKDCVNVLGSSSDSGSQDYTCG